MRNFKEACELLKQGVNVSRKPWTGVYLTTRPADCRGTFFKIPWCRLDDGRKVWGVYRSHLEYISPDNEDFYSKDWEIHVNLTDGETCLI